MLDTAEVRWFQPGAAPAAVAGWFDSQPGPALPQPPREDLYLRLADDSLGIKLREGRVEVKQRRQELGEVRFHPQAAGRVELWRKWSFDLAAIDSEAAVARQSGDWTAVAKTRVLHRYQLDDSFKMIPIPDLSQRPQGCDLELTAIESRGQRWWSLGFEAYGPEAALVALLEEAVRQALRETGPGLLPGSESYGYARWMTRLDAA